VNVRTAPIENALCIIEHINIKEHGDRLTRLASDPGSGGIHSFGVVRKICAVTVRTRLPGIVFDPYIRWVSLASDAPSMMPKPSMTIA
jgi:hypothetical protein